MSRRFLSSLCLVAALLVALPSVAAPDAGSPCGKITLEGCCQGQTLQYCLGGQLQTRDCTTSLKCGWDSLLEFYYCETSGGADPSGIHPMACPTVKPDASVPKDLPPPAKDKAVPAKDLPPPAKDQSAPGKDKATPGKDSGPPTKDSALPTDSAPPTHDRPVTADQAGVSDTDTDSNSNSEVGDGHVAGDGRKYIGGCDCSVADGAGDLLVGLVLLALAGALLGRRAGHRGNDAG